MFCVCVHHDLKHKVIYYENTVSRTCVYVLNTQQNIILCASVCVYMYKWGECVCVCKWGECVFRGCCVCNKYGRMGGYWLVKIMSYLCLACVSGMWLNRSSWLWLRKLFLQSVRECNELRIMLLKNLVFRMNASKLLHTGQLDARCCWIFVNICVT